MARSARSWRPRCPASGVLELRRDVEARAVVDHVQDHAVLVAIERQGRRARCCVLGGVAQSLLGDPVDESLLRGVQAEVLGGVDVHLDLEAGSPE